MNKIDQVQKAVFEYDKQQIGLPSESYELAGVSQSDFEMYVPAFETRLDMIAYELAWIIYTKNNNAPDVQQFRDFCKFNKIGTELFNKAKELARSKVSERVVLVQVPRKSHKQIFQEALLIAALTVFAISVIMIICSSFLHL